MALPVVTDILQTQDMLLHKNVIDHSSCFFCNQQSENSTRLYFNCVYTREVWKKVKASVEETRPVAQSEREWHEILMACICRNQAKEIKGPTMHNLI